MLGAAPHSQRCRKHEVYISRSPHSRTRPLCNRGRHTHTPSRRCAPCSPSCSLACSHFFFHELPLLTRPHLTQPLLLTFETDEKSAFSSPYDVSVAAARQDICTISRQLNNRVAVSSYGLCQVRSLHMLIAAAKRACGVRRVRAYTSHNPLSRVHAAYHVTVATVHGLSDSCALYFLCCLTLMTSLLRWPQVMAAPKVQGRLKRAKNEYVILAGSSLFYMNGHLRVG